MVPEVICIKGKKKEDHNFTIYHYNILIMLAKRLVKEEKQEEHFCKNNWVIERELVKRIVSA